ncbi:MAG: condensation domain-containing protein, partial [Ruminiclostridium sp.]
MKDIFKNNMDIYSKMIQNVTDYYKYYTKMLEELMDTYNPSNRNMKDKTGTFPANGHDIYNYVARYGMSNLQIQAIMKLDGRLDFDKLKRAIKLSVDAEPVLKCRF